MKAVRTVVTALLLSLVPLTLKADLRESIAKDVVFQEKDGLVAVEAEHFVSQAKSEKRAFYLTTQEQQAKVSPDGDPNHVGGASGGAYLEILPDTRRTHADKLIKGENFSPEAGQQAVLSYKVNFQTTGRYYVWVRAYSTGSEDNGLHVGIDGEWPESGQRLQWCEGKQSWRWDSKQRTEKVHCGEPGLIFLDIEKAGEHTIHFSMREDGFEFDKWLMTTDKDFKRPSNVGPKSLVHSGELPQAFAYVPVEKKEEASPTLAVSESLFIDATQFPVDNTGFYIDQKKWLAINPDKINAAKSDKTFQFPTGVYDVTLLAVGENDGHSFYEVKVDGVSIGKHICLLAKSTFEEGPRYHKTFPKVQITEGAIITVSARIGSKDGEEFSRARWSGVEFTPADEATKKAAAPLIAKQGRRPSKNTAAAKTVKGNESIPVSKLPLIMPRKPNGDGTVEITGELKQWHTITLTYDGLYAHEKDNKPNPFTDCRMTVEFFSPDGEVWAVPGYFAADGDAANSSAESGTKWRAHFTPNVVGEWRYEISLLQGEGVALDDSKEALEFDSFGGASDVFTVAKSDKQGRDLRAHGRLQYVGKPYLQFAGSKKYFIKAGADAPETLLGYVDFDNTIAGNPKKVPLKTWEPHIKDWQAGDPTWKDGKGKGLIGAVNYLSGKGCNAFSFLTYNAGGDGDNVWPFIQREDKLHYDCSKLDQWGIVFEHGTHKGMYLHFKLQETENDDNRKHRGAHGVPEALDGGELGPQRKLYLREMIARYGHNLALNWNLGEENTQSTEEQQAMLNYITEIDPYQHNRVLHTFPEQQDEKYNPLLGDKSKLTGLSLQNSNIKDTHSQTVKWAQESAKAGKPWIVAFDESGSAAHAQCPDLGYKGYNGHDKTGKMTYTEHEVRKQTLWGQLMGGGAGVEYYFGYQYVENDLICEDWRSRDRSWDYCRIALEFFHNNKIPFWEMTNHDELVSNKDHDNSIYCLAKPNEIYLVYLPNGGTAKLDLKDATGEYKVHWYNPRTGGELLSEKVYTFKGGNTVTVGPPPKDQKEDWLVVLRN